MVYHYTRRPTLVISDQVFFFLGKTRKSYKSKEGPPGRRLQPWLFHCLQIHCLTNGPKYSHTKKKSVFSDNPLFAS